MTRLVRVLLAAFAVALLPAGLAAQDDGTIAGVVTDRASGRPLPEVQVQVAGTQRGSMTDREGRFTIRGVPAGTYEVRARRVGYAPMSERVAVGAGATASVNFVMTESALTLQEVVVSAVTGAQERRVEIGTNVGQINVSTLQKGPITKLADVLQGRVAGVQLQSATGTSGGGQRIRIRGANSLSLSNEPLIFIDGVRASNSSGGYSLGGQDYSRLNDINPEEIENIDILKGPAAAALYGSVASNGVILITTKRGQAGAPQWRMYVEGSSFKDESPYPHNYAALQANDPTQPTHLTDGLLNITRWGLTAYTICPNYTRALGTCRQDVLESFDQFEDSRTTPYQTGSRAKTGINVSGGSDMVTYFVSGDRDKELGVLRPNDVKRTSLRTNLNARFGSKLSGAVTGTYIRSETQRISNDNSIFSPLINAFLGPSQYIPGMESDTVGVAGARNASYFGFNTADQRKYKTDQTLDRFVVGTNGNYTPLSWLRVNGNVGLDYFGRFDRLSLDPNVLPIASSFTAGNRSATRSNNYLWTSNASASAKFQPMQSLITTTTLGGAYERALFENVDCYGVGVPAGTGSCGSTTREFAVDEAFSDLKTVGGFGRQELAIADRLFLSASVRADNNSGLVRDVSGLAYYPSANASWLVSRESFFPRIGLISELRLRAGWGQAGQRPGFGDAETFFSSRAIQLGGAESPALVLTSTGNQGLKVERTTELEGGFDAGFFDGRISTEVTVFTRESQDALVSRNLAPSSGLTGTVFQNLGSVKNWGTEFGLNVNALNTERVGFDIRLTATTLRNRIDELGEGIAPIQFNRGAQAHREGFPTGAFFAAPIKFNDANGDGKLSRLEVTVDTSKFLRVRNATGGIDTLTIAYVGPSLPTNTQGLNLALTLVRNVTISTLFERRAGHKQLNYTERFRCTTLDANPVYGQCGALSNPDASLESQAAFIGARFMGATPFGYIEDATFVKWRELSLRVGVPEAVSNRIGALRGAALSFAGRNLGTWTDYTGLDPEINETGGGTNFTQGEFNTQPPVRTFTLRFDFRL
ncbi:MAG: SusC/RagA family TonB-linked outer membrane protein [Gemmatimonadaceae bacterium]|nr:SusC/RagA family TonB-linked outer membrane protein [Gemmatimonadaceae bacterium]